MLKFNNLTPSTTVFPEDLLKKLRRKKCKVNRVAEDQHQFLKIQR